jgi:hypothetical protein
MWRAADSAFGDDDLFQLRDYALLNFGGRAFADSAERRRVWLDRIFKKPAPGASNATARTESRGDLTYMLRRLAAEDRVGVGGRMIAELRDETRPAHFRGQVVAAFLRTYLEAEPPEPEWEPALQDAVGRLATDLHDPQDFRILAMDLRRAATDEIKPAGRIGIRRHFFVRPSTRAALEKRATELRARAQPGDPDQSALAARELQELLAVYGAAADHK